MVNIYINNSPVAVPEESSILEAAKLAGVDIPHLCYLKELNEIGACRLCCVEVEGENHLVPACENQVVEGMKIKTTGSRIRSAVRTNLQLILSQHDGHCTQCTRSGNCQLQNLANEYGLVNNPFPQDLPSEKALRWPQEFPLIRDNAKCIKCMRCIQVCDKIQHLGIWDVNGSGARTQVTTTNNTPITLTDCSLCGQCITHCPVGALRERDDIDKTLDAIADPQVVTVAQIAPAVRTAWGEALGLDPKDATVNKIAAVLKAVGVDYVFDTSFTADLTIMEEGSELLERLAKGDMNTYPMFTSCCPGWVRFIKTQYPMLVPQLSSAKSPQQMFGALIKSTFAKRIGVEPSKIFSISVMPCVAKKAEAALPTMAVNEGLQDVDVVLTTREMARLTKAEHIRVSELAEVSFDKIMGEYTGAGVIFGTTGGVMEAALRSGAYLVTGKNPDADAFQTHPSGIGPWNEGSFKLGDATLRIAVTSGLANTKALCDAIINGSVKYDFVEIMACPGGCAGGGGQPIHCDDEERACSRGNILKTIDKNMPIRFSHENEEVQVLYKEELEKPLSELAEHLLHTSHTAWKMPNEK